MLFPVVVVHILDIVGACVAASVLHLILESEDVMLRITKAARNIVLVHRTVLVLVMAHRTMRSIVLLVLLMHLHIAKSLVALRPIHHIIVVLISIVEHGGSVRSNRMQR